MAPELVEKVRLHTGTLPVMEEFHVAEQVRKALERKVWLESGGYIIIDRTEAMTVIDVNTGKHVGKTNLEETVTQTNIEAAEEIARQLRLRDIGGMIIIDFIDMLLERNRGKVIRAMKSALASDRTRSQVFDISPARPAGGHPQEGVRRPGRVVQRDVPDLRGTWHPAHPRELVSEPEGPTPCTR